ncbi:hypothetical protein EDB89DRAFT_2064450 [Lactarius sanguifluus]|nr:hypothetical protein EDB89DRAFT_2064450 [Lactarius sanguifluus]
MSNFGLDDDDDFMDPLSDDDIDPALPRPTQHTRPPASSLSGASRLSAFSSRLSQVPSRPAEPASSLKPSGISPDGIARLTYNEHLRNEEALKGRIRQLEHSVSVLVHENLELRRLGNPHGVTANLPLSGPFSSDISLGSSDSLSHGCSGGVGRAPTPAPTAGPTSCPLSRPARLPPSVLWTFEDCKNDPLVGMTKSNSSRPAVHKALRHEDGTGITISQWKTIRASARAIASSALACLFSRDPRASGPRGKKYFKDFFLDEWNAAISELEAAVPILALCPDDWKADRTLGKALSHLTPHPPSPSTSRPFHSPAPQQPRLPSEPVPAPDVSRPQTQKTSVGSKSHSLAPQQPPRLSPEPALAPGTSGPHALKTSVGSKSKRARDPSPPQRPSKRAKSGEGKGKGKGKETPGAEADASYDQPPPSPPAFLRMARAEAPLQPRARLRTGFKNIVVRPSAPNLIEIITNEFPTILGAADLLQAMQKATNVEAHEPSNDVAVLLDRLEGADPDSMDDDDDNSNESWGHAQFTAGGLTIRSALVDWEAVGGLSTALKLIAAAVRTCKVARALCTARGRSATAYLADSYLGLLFERLQHCWEDAQSSCASPLTAAAKSSGAEAVPSRSSGAEPSAPATKSSHAERATTKSSRAAPVPSKSSGAKPPAPATKSSLAERATNKSSRAEPVATKSSRVESAAAKSSQAKSPLKRATLARVAKANHAAAMNEHKGSESESASPETPSEDHGAKTTHSGDESEEDSDDGGKELPTLKYEELLAWIKTHKISGKRHTKPEAISTIRNAPAPKRISKDDIKRIINERAPKKITHKG